MTTCDASRFRSGPRLGFGFVWAAAGFITAFGYALIGDELSKAGAPGNWPLVAALSLGVGTAYLAGRRAVAYAVAYLAGVGLAFMAVVAFLVWVFSQPNLFTF
jgi:hypothetical protein